MVAGRRIPRNHGRNNNSPATGTKPDGPLWLLRHITGIATKRHNSTRVFGSNVVLDNCRSREQAARFQSLLQQPSHAYFTGRANAGYARVTTSSRSPLVSMATSLSEALSDAGGGVIFQRLSIAAVSGQPWENFQLNHRVFAFLIAARSADPIV
jgi:hypothetical protein